MVAGVKVQSWEPDGLGLPALLLEQVTSPVFPFSYIEDYGSVGAVVRFNELVQGTVPT